MKMLSTVEDLSFKEFDEQTSDDWALISMGHQSQVIEFFDVFDRDSDDEIFEVRTECQFQRWSQDDCLNSIRFPKLFHASKLSLVANIFKFQTGLSIITGT
jgi:hypothetical protein